MEEINEKYHLTDAMLFTDCESMLDSGRIDMVMICTPHLQHPKMAVAAIERNIHTLIEKPVGIFPEELAALEEKTQVLCPVADAINAQRFIQGAYLSSWKEQKMKLPVDTAAYTEELRKRMK